MHYSVFGSRHAVLYVARDWTAYRALWVAEKRRHQVRGVVANESYGNLPHHVEHRVGVSTAQGVNQNLIPNTGNTILYVKYIYIWGHIPESGYFLPERQYYRHEI